MSPQTPDNEMPRIEVAVESRSEFLSDSTDTENRDPNPVQNARKCSSSLSGPTMFIVAHACYDGGTYHLAHYDGCGGFDGCCDVVEEDHS